MQFNPLKIAVMTAILSTTMSSLVFATESTATYASVLGQSSNPAPSSVGMPATASAMPIATMMGPNGTQLSGSLSSNDYRRTTLPSTNVAAPAWAQGPLTNATSVVLRPFASNLFEGRFAGTFSDMTSSDYILAPGDRVVVRIWGARSYDDVLVVDQQGNLFLPEVGPIHVAGLRQSSLLSTVKQAIGRVFTDNVQVYVNLQSAQPVAVYVTGFVNSPGRYAGGSLDSIMSFIDRAGGIDAARGSYRHIEVIRNKKVVEKLDLYRFALEGTVPNLRLKNGDVILVKEKGISVSAYGLLREQAIYEFSRPSMAKGSGLIELSSPERNVSHVSVVGSRDQAPFNRYFSIEEFKTFTLSDSDIVEFVADKPGETIMATVTGAIISASRYPIRKTMKLRDLLRQIEVEPELAATDAVYLRRKSVARDQKAVIQDSLRRLEQTALTSTSSTPEEAQVRVKEAELIQDFVKRASQLEPDGVVVISRRGQISDLWLEDGDEIVIPQKSNVVMVTGEVVLPKTVAFERGMSLDDYLAAAGGVSSRANDEQILVVKQNGEVGLCESLGIEPGDRIMVLPKIDTKGILVAKDIMQIIYQIAVATKVMVDL
jgi:protein involved in polysaccharide export with SLBB domain